MVGSSPPLDKGEEVDNALQKKTAKEKQAAENIRASAQLRECRLLLQILRLNNDFGILNFPDGDTLAYIGPPPQTLRESQSWGDAYNQNHFSVPHRVHSGNFLSLNSKKFNDLFGPRSIRTERRFRKEGILSRVSTKGIKYFVDLRPPTEDDEAVVLLTSLTCTKGVLTWHAAEEKYGLPPLLIRGQDDSSAIPGDFWLPTDPSQKEMGFEEGDWKVTKKASHARQQSWGEERADGLEAREGGRLTGPDIEEREIEMQNVIASPFQPREIGIVAAESPPTKPTSLTLSTQRPPATASKASEKPLMVLPEYSPLRHRSAIERLVQAMENGDPKLDSAPKVWTFFAVAKYFGCAADWRIKGWITQWLLHYPNCYFIQSNPEVALRIGLGIQSEEITKDAFSILVGEKSLMNVFGESDSAILSPLEQSVHGRMLELLDDDERNRIDHAAASLVRRVRHTFDELVGDEMTWLQRSVRYRKITSLVPHNDNEAEIIKNLIQKIKQFVRGRIIWVLRRSYEGDFVDFEQALSTVRSFYPNTRQTFRETYNVLNERERIFTRFFWVALHQEGLDEGSNNLRTEQVRRLGNTCPGSTYLSQKMLDRTLPGGERVCQIVSKNEVDSLLIQFNQIEKSRRAAKMQTATQTRDPTLPAASANQDPQSVPELLATKAEQEKRGTWASDGFKGIKNLRDTSPKREQPLTTPPIRLAEKRRKLSDADAGSPEVTPRSFTVESLPIRSRVANLSASDRDLLQPRDDPVQNTHLETPNTPDILAPTCTNASQSPSGTMTVGTEASELVPSPRSDSKTLLGVYNFGYDGFRIPNFQPILPNIPGGGWSMEDATHREHIADVAWRPNSMSDNDNNEAPAKISSDRDTGDSHVNAQRPRPTTADHLSGMDDGTTGRFVTATDWYLEDGDVDWSEPVAMQQFSDYGSMPPRRLQSDCVYYTALFHDITMVLHGICNEIINPNHLFHGDNMLPTNLIDTLMCLTYDEWKYLPLWAGGNDDGTGGVFDEVDVPNLEAGGFKGGKRGMGSVRNTAASSSVSGSSFDDVGSDAISTVGKASKAATDGTRTVRSLSDMGSEEEGFTIQNELWNEIRNMNIDEAEPAKHDHDIGAGKGKERADDLGDGFDNDDMDAQDADDVDTIVGVGSVDDDNDDIDVEEDFGVSAFDDDGTDD